MADQYSALFNCCVAESESAANSISSTKEISSGLKYTLIKSRKACIELNTFAHNSPSASTCQVPQNWITSMSSEGAIYDSGLNTTNHSVITINMQDFKTTSYVVDCTIEFSTSSTDTTLLKMLAQTSACLVSKTNTQLKIVVQNPNTTAITTPISINIDLYSYHTG